MSEMGRNDAAASQALRTSATETSVRSSLASWKHGLTWDDALAMADRARQFLRQGVWTTGSQHWLPRANRS